MAFEVKQLHLEEPSLTVLGVAPGFCDTKMIQVLLEGGCEFTANRSRTNKPLTLTLIDDGWSAEDGKKYREAVAGWPLTSPKTAGRAYAYAVTKASREISGSVVEFDDPKIQALLA